MTEAIKHGIVLLQIAKNATLPDGSSMSSSLLGFGADVKESSPPNQAQASPLSRPHRSKPAPKVIAALENTFSLGKNRL